jgi:hypothetical protein
VKMAFIVAACVMTCACTKHQTDGDAKGRITVCGTVQRQDGSPVPKALIELHERAKDTSNDPFANRYEVVETANNGRFVFRSGYADRQYWLSINGTSVCKALSRNLDSRRVPVMFRRSAAQVGCDGEINLVAEDDCDLKVH